MSAHWTNDDGSLAAGLWVAQVTDPELPPPIMEQALYLTQDDAPGDSCIHATTLYAESEMQVEIVTFDGCVAWSVMRHPCHG